MTDQLTDNEVIAKFDGKQNVFIHPKLGAYQAEDDQGSIDWVKNDFQSLDYSRDWRLLMPVWYKFRDLQFGSFGYRNEWLNHSGVISNAILYHGCSEACKLLAEGIRWYNSIKK